MIRYSWYEGPTFSQGTLRPASDLLTHHGIDQSVAQLRGLFGVLSSISQSRTEVSLWPEDLANLIWLLQDQVDLLDRHAQALYIQSLKKEVC